MSTALTLLLTAASLGSNAPPDVSGRWARLQTTTSLVDIPILGESEVETTALTIVDITKNGPAYEMREIVCALDSKSMGDLVETRFPPAFLRAVSGQTKPLSLEKTGDRYVWIEPRVVRIIGGVDDRPIDEDGDGKPGLTVQVRGFVDGDVYVAQEGWQAGRGQMLAPDRVVGTLRFEAKQRILGATKSMLENALPQRPHPDPEKSRFRMRRVPKRATCAEVIQRRTRLLGG